MQSGYRDLCGRTGSTYSSSEIIFAAKEPFLKIDPAWFKTFEWFTPHFHLLCVKWFHGQSKVVSVNSHVLAEKRFFPMSIFVKKSASFDCEPKERCVNTSKLAVPLDGCNSRKQGHVSFQTMFSPRWELKHLHLCGGKRIFYLVTQNIGSQNFKPHTELGCQ